MDIEVNLEPGSYIILPRTTGCSLRGPWVYDPTAERPKLLILTSSTDMITRQVTTSDGRLTLSALFENTVIDIFNRFDLSNTKALGYEEFKQMCDLFQKPMSEDIWKT